MDGFLVGDCAGVSLTIAGFFGHWGYYWELTCHFRVQYFWLTAAGALVLLLSRRFRRAAAVATFAAANLALIVPLYFGGAAGPPESKVLRVLSFNVFAENDRYADFLAMVEEDQPDIIVLIDYTTRWELAMQPLKTKYPHCAASPVRAAQALRY